MSEDGNKGTNGALTMHHPYHESIAGTTYSWLFTIHNYSLAPKFPLFKNNENIWATSFQILKHILSQSDTLRQNLEINRFSTGWVYQELAA